MKAATPDSDTLTSRTRVPAAGTESEDARRELVRRIVVSPAFARSERLGTLLTYVCEMALQGREKEINEQKIGAEVFGRAPDYDSGVDGIVRSQASRLRQRLELYFQHEGAQESLRVVIPRGGYVPIFEQQASPAEEATGEQAAASPDVHRASGSDVDNARSSRSPWMWWMPWGISLTLGLLCIALWIQGRRHLQPQAVLRAHALWSQLFSKDVPTLIVAPDSGLVLYHAMTAKDINLKEYLEGTYRNSAGTGTAVTSMREEQQRPADLANRRYTSLVDLNSILNLRDRAQSLGSEVNVRYARDLRPNDLKNGTVVLLGAYTANPWVELYEPRLNFILKDDYVKSFSVVNRRPQKNEPASWTSSSGDPHRPAFGVIAYLPSLEGRGHALLLEGIGMSGTEAAMDFLNDDVRLFSFLNQIRRPDGSIPHFELLLSAHSMDASAVESQIISWRVSQ